MDFDDYVHHAGECFRAAYAHFTEPRWCGHPRCMFETHGGDLRSIEESLGEHGYNALQVSRMMESFYLPLHEEKARER